MKNLRLKIAQLLAPIKFEVKEIDIELKKPKIVNVGVRIIAPFMGDTPSL